MSDRETRTRWAAGALVLLGVLGVALALTAVLSSLPAPAAGGTCGPGRTSESAAAAFFDPGSIGAGVQPRPAGTAQYFQWQSFIGECQSATDGRILVGVALLVGALACLVAGILLARRARRGPHGSSGWGRAAHPSAPTGVQPVQPVGVQRASTSSRYSSRQWV